MTARRSLLPILVMLLVSVVFASARDQSSNGSGQALRRFGLFIGANDGGAGRTRLLYAVSDSRSMAEVMYEVGGLQKDDSIVTIDPSPEQLEQRLLQMRGLIASRKAAAPAGQSPRTEFILYYSGHSDEQGLLLGGRRFDYRDLHDALKEMNVDVSIAVLDSCDSGAFIRLKGGQRVSPFLVDESAQMKGQVYLTSSSEDEASQESDAIGGSFFTQSLISGLRGAADFSKDGRVTIDEAYQFARTETTARTEKSAAGPQHPAWHIELTGTGDLVLTDIRSISAGLIVSEEVDGRLAVRDSNGKLAVEIHKAAGTSLSLALPPGTYTVSTGTANRYLEATVRLRSGGWSEVRSGDFISSGRLSSRSRGDGAGAASDAGDEFLAQDWGLANDADVLDKTVERYLRRVTPPGPNAAAEAANASRAGADAETLPSGVSPDGETPPQGSLGDPSTHSQVIRSEEVHPFAPIAASFVPGLGLPPLPFGAVKGLSFNLLAGESYAIHGAEFGGIINITTHDLDGAQFAGVGNIVGGPARWVQAAGVFNLAGGGATGVQAAGVFNIAGAGSPAAPTGAKIRTLAADYPPSGSSAGETRRTTGFTGAQGAGVFNIAAGNVNGAQAAGVFNVAGGEVRGAQLGLINIAGPVTGVQIGLVNIATEMHGLALGLVNISRNGFMSLSGYTDGSGLSYADFQSGGTLYSVLFTGWSRPADAAYNLISYGAGLGLHLDIGPLFGEIDGSAKTLYAAAPGITIDETQLIPYLSMRTKVGFLLFRKIGGFIGYTFDFTFPHQVANSFAHTGTTWSIPVAAGTIRIYPKFTTGITLRL